MNITKLIVLSTLFALTTVLFGCASTPKQEGFGEYIDDSVITTKVKSALFGNSEISGFDITVETFKGRVHLSGLVDSISQANRAEDIAREVKGVELVQNNLTVK